VLELMAEKLGEDFEGVVSGTTGSGVFIQLEKFLIDGFIKLNDIPAAPGDRWRLNRQTGALVAMRSGKTISIGDRFKVRIASVDLARRQMQLVIVNEHTGKPPRKEPRKQPRGAAVAHDQTRQLKKQRNDPKPGFRNKPTTPGSAPGKTSGKKNRGRKRR
jgi:ribonuclease R